jgi:hypothetical protein
VCARRSSYMADCVLSGTGNCSASAGAGSGCAGAAGSLFFFFAGAFLFARLGAFFARDFLDFFLAGIVASLQAA